MIKLMLGDCLERLKEIPDNSVDLVLTDPPYDIKNTKAGGSNPLCGRLNKSQGELSDKNIVSGFNTEILYELIRVNKNINMYFFCNKAQLPMYIDFFVTQRKCSFDLVKWVKTNTPPTFKNKYLSDTEYCILVRKKGWCNPENYQDASTLYQSQVNKVDKNLYNHPTPKPVELLERLVRNSTQNSECIILDPFMGSGSTGVAARNLGRSFIGIELDREYFKTSMKRIHLK